jgi:hypothetical protein
MMTSDDLEQCLLVYGRGPVQECVTRSQNIQDTVHYIQVERSLEVLRLASFVTKDLVSFEKKKKNP